MDAKGAVNNGDTRAFRCAALVWGYGQERSYALLAAALQGARREGIAITELPGVNGSVAGWAKAIAECVADGTCSGGVLFCDDPGLVCCVANKVT